MGGLEESQVGPTQSPPPTWQPPDSSPIPLVPSCHLCRRVGVPNTPRWTCGIQMVQLIALETVNLCYYPSSPSALLCCHLKALRGVGDWRWKRPPSSPTHPAQALFLLSSQGGNYPVVTSSAYV